jgi:hypothetical protein
MLYLGVGAAEGSLVGLLDGAGEGALVGALDGAGVGAADGHSSVLHAFA